MSATEIVQGNFIVNRDMDLIRTILIKVRDKKDLVPELISIDGRSDDEVGRHVEILFDAGFIDGSEMRDLSMCYCQILIKDLSWEGHEFLSNILKEEVWNKLKDSLGADGLSSLSWEVLKDAAKSAASEWVKKKLGFT